MSQPSLQATQTDSRSFIPASAVGYQSPLNNINRQIPGNALTQRGLYARAPLQRSYQPQRSSSTSALDVHPTPRAALSFKIEHTKGKKRRFIDVMSREADGKCARKRRKLSVKRKKYWLTEYCSSPYQELVNGGYMRKQMQTQQPQIHALSRKPFPARSHCIRENKHRGNNEGHDLMDSDQLIEKWDNVLHGLSFEIIRNSAKSDQCLKNATTQSVVEQKENKYLQKLNALKIKCQDLFDAKLIEKHYLSHCSRFNSVYSYIGCGGNDTHCFVLNDEVRFKALTINCDHKLYLWSDGFSYHSMDNYHPYQSHSQFVSFIDQCLIPPQWINHTKRELVNSKFFDEQQLMRLQRKVNAAKQSYKNELDTFVSSKAKVAIQRHKSKHNDVHHSYFEGDLFLELIDFRYVCPNENEQFDAYQYKQSCSLQRILLKSDWVPISQTLHDITSFHLRQFKSRHCDDLHRLHTLKQQRKYNALSQKYPFFIEYQTQSKKHYALLMQQMVAKHHEMQQMYQNYSSYMQHVRHSKILKQIKTSLLQQFYDSDETMHRTQYQKLKEKVLAFEKLKANGKEYSNMIQREQSRLNKLLCSPIAQYQIEKHVLLRLHPQLCLAPSLEVMQCMNYVHYCRSQSLVRCSFNHKQIAQKMKAYYEDTDGECQSDSNVIVDGINESQKFLHFIEKHGNEYLLNKLESMRNEIEYLYDVGQDNENEMKEPRKHPGQWIPQYSAKHYETKCCILRVQSYNENQNHQRIVLRIDFIQSNNNLWLQHNGLWLLTVSRQNETEMDYQYYLNNIKRESIVYSQECLTLNCAAKLFYQHLRYQLYKNNATLIFTQNTKFDHRQAPSTANDIIENDVFSLL